VATIHAENPYMPSRPGAITYEVLPNPNGWSVVARFSRRVNSKDRRLMLDSLTEYKRSIETQHPSWVVSLFVSESSYSLEIIRSKDMREVFGALQNKALDFWGRLPNYAA
jgi:hypothetical protein